MNFLMGRPSQTDLEFDEITLSALKEIGTILAGSYLTALSNLTNLEDAQFSTRAGNRYGGRHTERSCN